MSGEQRLLDRPDGLYVGIDPGRNGAVALVRRVGGELTLLRVVLARDARPTDCTPWDRAAWALGQMAELAMLVAGAAVEAPGARPGQTGALVAAQSGGAYAGILAWRQVGLVVHMPRPEQWMADLACLATDGDTKAAHLARLLDVCPGAAQHVRQGRATTDHDGAVDAALLALWAAGLRGPGPNSPVTRLSRLLVSHGYGESVPGVLLSAVGPADDVVMDADTRVGLSRLASAGVRAAKYGRRVVEPLAEELLRALVAGGRSEAVRKEARAALVAWGLTP